MGKFAWPVWETLNASSPEVIADFPHVWTEFRLDELIEHAPIPSLLIALCAQCFVLRCTRSDQDSRCLLPVYHGPRHVNEANHRWDTS